MSFDEAVTAVLLAAGAFMFLAGTAGLLRFPDVYGRLHALTKADNLGLGLVTAGLAVEAGSLNVALRLALVWLVLMLAGTTSCHLVARAALRMGVRPWSRP